MAVLTDDIEVTEKDGIKLTSPMAVDIIFRGALLMMNAAGFIAPAAAAAGGRFVGLSEAKLDNSGGSAGDLNAKYVAGGLALLTGTGFAQTDVGVKVYASDDQTITKTFAADLPYVGIIEQFQSSTKVFVRLQKHSSIGEAAIADLGAFTDPPSAGEMATLRTTVNSILAALRGERIIQG